MVRDVENQEPIGVSYIVGSISTRVNKNPNFGVLKVDPLPLIPLEWESWAFDIKKANSAGTGTFEKLFEYKNEYSLLSLSPSNF